MRSLGVVVPAFNESRLIEKILDRVAAQPDVAQIVVVDDASSDATSQVLPALRERLGLTVIRHPVNRGKGAAVRTGFRHVSAEWTIVQDADLEYDPGDYGTLLAAAGAGEVVYGSRYLGRPRAERWHTLGNRALTFLSNLMTGLHLTDMETCYKLIPTRIARALPLRCDRFGFEPEVTARLARRGLRIREVPVSYARRNYSEGKKITWKDAVRTVVAILYFSITR